ncbi:MAG: CxxC-x17-CxxC domain-containing protein [Patescibacteria group bacterium]|jgi:CxxC-x17-CxxC domain-containing protein
MKKFQRDDRFGSDRGDRDSRRASMHQAVCSECGKRCEVPFKPTGDRPVYCSECFSSQNQQGKPDFDRPERKSFDRKSFDKPREYDRPRSFDRPMFEAVCDKCGKKCELPFRPTQGKPIYCSDCFENITPNKSRNVDSSNDQLTKINIKLDLILKMLTPKADSVPVEKKIVASEKKTVKEIKKPKKEKATVVKTKTSDKKKK